MSNEDANVIKHDGVTLFRNTVVGIIDDTQALITVGTLSQEWKEARDIERTHYECITDALRTLVDECLEERKSDKGTPLDKALQHALTLLEVPAQELDPTREFKEPSISAGVDINGLPPIWHEGRGAYVNDYTRDDGHTSVNPHKVGSSNHAMWRFGYAGVLPVDVSVLPLAALL